MTVADAIIAFLKSRKDKYGHLKSATHAEIIAGVKEGTPASRNAKLRKLLDRGDVRSYANKRRDKNGHLKRHYALAALREWCDADQRLVELYEAEAKANTVTRRCMCCRQEFGTDQAYRLCPVCRGSDVGSACDYGFFAEAA